MGVEIGHQHLNVPYWVDVQHENHIAEFSEAILPVDLRET
jgi:hypothetical protein